MPSLRFKQPTPGLPSPRATVQSLKQLARQLAGMTMDKFEDVDMATGLSSEYPFSVRWGSRYTSVSGVYAASASSNAAKDLVSEDR